MDTNLKFEYGIAGILDGIDGDVSRHAAFLRFQDGGSAYDALLVHTNDKPTIEEFVAEAFRAVLSHFYGEGKYETKDGKHVLSLYLPDYDEDLYPATKDEIERYVITSVVSNWLVYRSFGDYAKMVSSEADGCLNRLISFLRTRKFPIE